MGGWSDDFYSEIPYIIGHYLKLNLTFIDPTQWLEWFQFNHKQDWVEATLKIMKDEELTTFLNQFISVKNYFILKTSLFPLAYSVA